jgi:antitoxin PrlF
VFTSLLDGTVVMRAKTRSLMDLKGLLKRPKGASKVSVDDMQIGRD